jgi:hypothetical protein
MCFTRSLDSMLRSILVLLLDPDEMFHVADYFINAKNVKNNDSWMGIMIVMYLALATVA